MGREVTDPDGAQPPVPARYALLGVLGHGGMGKVYRARDTQLDREVAIKVIEKSDIKKHGTDRAVSVERFVREARAAARLDHPNIVAVHDVDPEAGWLVMGLVEGKSLDDVPRPLPAKRVRRIAEQVLSALEAAHGAGVIHRDVKPANIIVDETFHVTLIDFGVARLIDANVTHTGEGLGTPAYMAPEQLRGGAVDARTDLYALGATLYELVTGERMIAFETPSPDAIARVRLACTDQPGLARVIDHCVRADPNDRFDSATMALAALVNASESKLVKLAKRVSQRYPVAKRTRRAPWIVLLLLIAGAAAFYFATRTRAPDPRIAIAFTQAQRGEHEKAGQILDDLLGERPDDADALALRVLTAWWDGSKVDELIKRALAAPLSPAQRAMIRGIEFNLAHRDEEAIGLLAAADREMPNTPEIVYLLGEARFHAQHIEEGVTTLERAFQLDPRWQVAAHHVVERKLMLGDSAGLREIAAAVRPIDASAAAAIECRTLIGERNYADAVVTARAAILREETVAELHVCLTQAYTLQGDLAAAAGAAKRAVELWPIDLREWGGFGHHAEQLLYRGKRDDYLALVRKKPSRQRVLVLAMWPTGEQPQAVVERGPGTPFANATAILVARRAGKEPDLKTLAEVEVRSFGEALAAEARKDRAAALEHYRKALAVPSQGDIAMLVSHHLARMLYRAGDTAAAKQACAAVLAPRVYHAYRAVLLPDCVLWSGNLDAQKALAAAWEGSGVAHPSVAEIRKRLADLPP